MTFVKNGSTSFLLFFFLTKLNISVVIRDAYCMKPIFTEHFEGMLKMAF